MGFLWRAGGWLTYEWPSGGRPPLGRARLQVGKTCTSRVPLELSGSDQAGAVTLILFYVQRQE